MKTVSVCWSWPRQQRSRSRSQSRVLVLVSTMLVLVLVSDSLVLITSLVSKLQFSRVCRKAMEKKLTRWRSSDLSCLWQSEETRCLLSIRISLRTIELRHSTICDLLTHTQRDALTLLIRFVQICGIKWILIRSTFCTISDSKQHILLKIRKRTDITDSAQCTALHLQII